MKNQTICAYKELKFYEDKCKNCPGTEDIDICYISLQELKLHLQQFDKFRLEDKIGVLL